MSVKREAGFLRQSSWMVITTFTGGLLMMAVHAIGPKMGDSEYASFLALLRVLIVIGIPTVAMQAIFARQAAAVTNDAEQRRLIATVRAVLLGTFLIWLVCAVVILAALKPLSHLLKISNPASLCFMVAIGLVGLWIPVVKGLLQGQHRFFGLGWLQITDGMGRFALMLLAVLIFHGKAASAMFAVLIGQLMSISIGAWLTYPIWSARTNVRFNSKAWLAEAVPLTMGMGTVQWMSSIDMPFVQALFPEKHQRALYGGAMLAGFAIIQFIAPVALVMFARLVKSAARSEGTSSLGLTLKATILFGVLAGIGCSVFPKLPLQIIYFTKPQMWEAAPLVTWFAWALLPWTVANVLVQNLLAHGRFKVAIWLILIPAAYGASLCLQASALLSMKPFDAFIRIIQTLGVANTILCLVAAWFSRPDRAINVSDPVSEPVPAISGTASLPQERKGDAGT
jgi:O-antigen/teichoic acid export membrane protein